MIRAMLKNALITCFLLLATTHPSFGQAEVFHSHFQDCTEQLTQTEKTPGIHGDDMSVECGTYAMGHCVTGFFAPGGDGCGLVFSQSNSSFDMTMQSVTGLIPEADLPPTRT